MATSDVATSGVATSDGVGCHGAGLKAQEIRAFRLGWQPGNHFLRLSLAGLRAIAPRTQYSQEGPKN
jgi:hypothetical protein